MNYEDFKRELYEELTARKPKCVEELVLTSVEKNNQKMRDGIAIHFVGYENVQPTLYFEDYYKKYQDGYSVERIAEELTRISVDEYRRMEGYGFDNLGDLDVEKAKQNLTLRLVNKEWNENLMKTCAYIEMQDLIAIPYLQVERNSQTMSMQVNRDVQQQMLRMTDEELLSVARENLLKTEFEVVGMSERLREMVGETDLELFVPEVEVMHIMSNKDNWYGAAGLLSQNTMEKIQNKIGEEMFFILPSSVHETLIISASYGRDPEEMQEMVKEVNEKQVEPHERLGENVYFYNGQKLQICNSIQEVMKQIEEKWQQKKTQEQTQEQTQTHGRRKV